MDCTQCGCILLTPDERKSGICGSCALLKKLEQRKEAATQPLDAIVPGETIPLSPTAAEEAQFQQLLDAQIDRIQQATRNRIDAAWSHIESVSTRHADTAPGIYVRLIEETTLTLDDGSEITFNEPVSATTAYNYVAERAEQESRTIE